MFMTKLLRVRTLAWGLILTGIHVLHAEDQRPRPGMATLDDAPPAAIQPAAYTSGPQPMGDTVVGGETYGGPAPYGAYNDRYAAHRGYVAFNYTPGGRCNGRGNGFWAEQACRYRERNRCQSQALCNRLGSTFCFAAPLFWWDAGSRRDVIAVNPGYVDPRDTQLYSAQGYGVPMAVPLAPVVRDTYNYGWGMPSSRLTPVATNPVP